MKRLKEKFREQELKIYWIGFQDRISKLRVYSKKMGLYAVGFDYNDRVSYGYGIRYGAGLIYIDRDGMVRKRIAKGFSEQSLNEVMDRLMSPGFGNTPDPG